MKSQLFYLIILTLFFSCSQAQENDLNTQKEIPGIDGISFRERSLTAGFTTASGGLNLIPGGNYDSAKAAIESLRSNLGKQYLQLQDPRQQANFLDSSMEVLTNELLNKIIPYWYGTKWDFNGYSARPNQGTIACGYFVSTTLKHLGLNVNRYKLAQQGPKNEAKSIAIDTTAILHLEAGNIWDYLKNSSEGLYFIGLDNHVGYLFIKDKTAHFIHANYVVGIVMVEAAASSIAFDSDHYYLARITGNRRLAKKWLTQDPLQVITQ